MATETRRIVEATRAHARFLAWVTLTAFRSQLERGFWDFMLGGDEAYKLRYLEALATTEQLHWVHHSAFIVAEVDGRPASALCGYFEPERGGRGSGGGAACPAPGTRRAAPLPLQNDNGLAGW